MSDERLTLTIPEVAELLGISRNSAYALASENGLPVAVIRLGRRLVVSKEAFLRALGVPTDEGLAESGQDLLG